jgi:hypothetical protein
MTKPLRYDSAICFRLPKDLHLALIEAAGGQENVHPRLRALITQYVGKRGRERGRRPAEATNPVTDNPSPS